jgi:hypothetical protein
MVEKVELGKIASVGPDYIVWQNGTRKLQVTFADDWMFTKEESAAAFRTFVGKDAAIPIDSPFFIGVDFMPGDFEGYAKVIKLHHTVASVIAC